MGDNKGAFWRPGDSKPGGPSSMSEPAPVAPQRVLSKNVLSMKFMKRKEEGAQNSAEEANKRRKLLDAVQQVGNSFGAGEMQIDNSALVQPPSTNEQPMFTIETTDLYCTLPGRRSFNGFNKVVEREYSAALDLQLDVGSNNRASDEEILKQYEGLMSLPRGPGQGKKPKGSKGSGGIGKSGGGGGGGGGGGKHRK